jgi:DNA mismatch repair ATPase MutS
MDTQTFKDLEIFKSSGENKPIFDELDNTLTAGGRNALKRRFRHPLTNASTIRETQQTVEYLSKRLDFWEIHIISQEIQDAEDYIRSNLIPVVYRNKLQAGWQTWLYKVRYKNQWRFITYSIQSLIEFLNKLKTLVIVRDEGFQPQIVRKLQRQIQYLQQHDEQKILFNLNSSTPLNTDKIC